MAFFEELGKKITDAGQGVAQQTKNFTEVTRLNGAISDREKQAAALYTALGTAYYKAHAADGQAEEKETIAQITALLNEIAQYQEEVKRIKGIGKCPACGADVQAGAAFCPACGAAIPAPQTPPPAAPAGRVCPNCGQSVGAENIFCNHCGTRL